MNRRRLAALGRSARRNLIAGERLSARRIDERDRIRRKISAAHRVGGNGGVLVEDVVRFVARVVDLKVRPPVRVRDEMRNSQRAAERRAESVPRELRLCDWDVRPDWYGGESSADPPNV
jgi:hypothetical protein